MSELNVQQLLINFGAWVRDDNNDLGYGNPFNAILAAAPHLADDEEDCEQPVRFKNSKHMTDLDAAFIDMVLGKLKNHYSIEYKVLWLYYVKNKECRYLSERYVAESLNISKARVSKLRANAEGFLMGYLASLR